MNFRLREQGLYNAMYIDPCERRFLSFWFGRILPFYFLVELGGLCFLFSSLVVDGNLGDDLMWRASSAGCVAVLLPPHSHGTRGRVLLIFCITSGCFKKCLLVLKNGP